LSFTNTENVEQEIINRDLAALILTLTDKLTPKQKVVFTLVELEGLSFDEVSEVTGLTHEKISSNLYCAHRFIKEKLECIDENADNYVR
jgi:RNA polymerase sigma-70 factor (ECF subfamily)